MPCHYLSWPQYIALGGYGTCHIPTAPGVYDLDCVTWKPEGDQTLSFALTGRDSPFFNCLRTGPPRRSCTRPCIMRRTSREQNVLHVLCLCLFPFACRIFRWHCRQAQGRGGHPHRVQARLLLHPRRQGQGCEGQTRRVDPCHRQFFQRVIRAIIEPRG